MGDKKKRPLFFSYYLSLSPVPYPPLLHFLVARGDAADVVARLAEGGHAVAVARDVALAGVVAGEHEVNAGIVLQPELKTIRSGGLGNVQSSVNIRGYRGIIIERYC